MKKWIVLVMVAVLAMAVTPLALAGNGHGHKHANGKTKFQLVGTVSMDPVEGTLTVTVKSGTKTVKAFRESGEPMPIVVTAGTKIRLIVDGEAVAVDLGQLGVGAKVKIGGTIDRTDPDALVYTAVRVLAHPAPVVVEPLPEPTPEPGEEPAPEVPAETVV